MGTLNYLQDSPLRRELDFVICETEKEVSDQLTSFLVTSKNVIICGFSQVPNDQLPEILKGVNFDVGNPYLFFSQQSSLENTEYWSSKRATIEPSGIGLAAYLRNIFTDYIPFEPSNRGIDEFFQLGLREKERESILHVLKEKERAIIIINGLPGIGKKSLLREIIFRDKIRNVLTIDLYKDFSFDSFLKKLAAKFKIFQEDFEWKIQQVVLYRLSELRETILLVPSAHKINTHSNDFEQFLSEWVLLQRDLNTQNQFILLAENNIHFQDFLLKEATYTIPIYPLDKEHSLMLCKKMLAAISELEVTVDTSLNSQDIQGEPEEILFQLTGGHPYTIRELFEFCKKGVGIEEVLQDIDIQQEFIAYRNKILTRLLSIDQDEQRLLEYLSLFEEQFELDAIRELFPKPLHILEQMTGKMLLEVVRTPGKTVYQLPLIIKNHYINSLNEEEKNMYRDRISRYYEIKDLRSL